MPYNSFRNNSIVRRNLLNALESNSGVSILDTSQNQTQEIYICKVATTTNILLDGSVISIDDIAIVDGDIIAVWQQTDLVENGIYYANTDGFVRIDTNLLPIVVTINDGTLNKDKLLYLVSIDYEIGTSDIIYIEIGNFELPDGDLNSLFRYDGTEWIKTTNTTLTDGDTDNKFSLLNNTYPELKRAVINVTDLESTMVLESDPTAPTGGQLIYANTNESSESIDLIHENNDFISIYGTNNYRYVSLYNDSGEQLIIRSYKTPNATNINIQISDGTNVNFKVTNDGKIYTKAYPQIDTSEAAIGKVLTCVDSDGNTIWDDIPDSQIQSDWNQTDNLLADYIKNKPTIPDPQIQSDWLQDDNLELDYIKNKPIIPEATITRYDLLPIYGLTDNTTFLEIDIADGEVVSGVIVGTMFVSDGTNTRSKSFTLPFNAIREGENYNVDGSIAFDITSSPRSTIGTNNPVIIIVSEASAGKFRLQTRCFSGYTPTVAYIDYTIKPISDAEPIANTQIQSDWNQTDTGEVDYIKNKPDLITKGLVTQDTNLVMTGSTIESIYYPILNFDAKANKKYQLNYVVELKHQDTIASDVFFQILVGDGTGAETCLGYVEYTDNTNYFGNKFVFISDTNYFLRDYSQEIESIYLNSTNAKTLININVVLNNLTSDKTVYLRFRIPPETPIITPPDEISTGSYLVWNEF